MYQVVREEVPMAMEKKKVSGRVWTISGFEVGLFEECSIYIFN
jgi:hypothetical protein